MQVEGLLLAGGNRKGRGDEGALENQLGEMCHRRICPSNWNDITKTSFFPLIIMERLVRIDEMMLLTAT